MNHYRLELLFGSAWVRLPGLYQHRREAELVMHNWLNRWRLPGPLYPFRIVTIVPTAAQVRQDQPTDPSDLMTVDEALADPQSFVAGMEES